jgi:hypothetical protein
VKWNFLKNCFNYLPIPEVVPEAGVIGTGTAIDNRFVKDCP